MPGANSSEHGWLQQDNKGVESASAGDAPVEDGQAQGDKTWLDLYPQFFVRKSANLKSVFGTIPSRYKIKVHPWQNSAQVNASQK